MLFVKKYGTHILYMFFHYISMCHRWKRKRGICARFFVWLRSYNGSLDRSLPVYAIRQVSLGVSIHSFLFQKTCLMLQSRVNALVQLTILLFVEYRLSFWHIMYLRRKKIAKWNWIWEYINMSTLGPHRRFLLCYHRQL